MVKFYLFFSENGFGEFENIFWCFLRSGFFSKEFPKFKFWNPSTKQVFFVLQKMKNENW